MKTCTKIDPYWDHAPCNAPAVFWYRPHWAKEWQPRCADHSEPCPDAGAVRVPIDADLETLIGGQPELRHC